MTAALAMPANTAESLLVHFFGLGLADDNRFVVERFKTTADRESHRCPDAAPKGGKRRRAKAVPATLKAVRELRPTPNEVIVCTGLRNRGGVQYWGSYAFWGHRLRLRSNHGFSL